MKNFLGLIICGLIFSACAHRLPEPLASSAKQIESTLIAQTGAVQACYQLGKHGGQGQVVLDFSITPLGDVKDLKIKETTLKQPVVENCVLNHLRKVKFSPPLEGQTVQVRYPITFRG